MDDLHTMEKYMTDFVQAVHKLTRIPLHKLAAYGTVNNLMNVLEHPFVLEPTAAQLHKIEQLNTFLRAYRVMKWEEENVKHHIRSPKQASDYFAALLEGVQDRELFLIAFLDNGNRIIETRTFSEGGIDYAPIDPRAILKAALYCDCTSLVLAHNHPGGTLSPSPEDLLLTSRLVDIFQPLRIEVLDHIIIGGNGYVSLAETGNLPKVAENPAHYEPFHLRAVEHNDLSIHEDIFELNDEWER